MYLASLGNSVARTVANVLALLPGLVLGSGCGESDPHNATASGDMTERCPQVCDHWRSVGCGDALAECEHNCDNTWSTPVGSACNAEAVAYYDCEVEQPTADYSCRDDAPFYNGTACSVPATGLESCISEHTEPAPACEHYCDLLGSICGSTDVDACKQSCANLSLLGGCEPDAVAFYDCLAPLPPSALTCVQGQVRTADATCDAARDALANCSP